MSGPTGRRPVTVLATRIVQLGREREFESFLSDLQDVFGAAPGHLRITIIRPEPPDREYTLVYQFESQSSLLAWERSDERAAAIARSASLTEHSPHERLLTGMETWFAVPTGGGAAEWRELDAPLVRQAALADPTGFVDFPGMMIIDEIQRVPDLVGHPRQSRVQDPEGRVHRLGNRREPHRRRRTVAGPPRRRVRTAA